MKILNKKQSIVDGAFNPLKPNRRPL